MRVVCQNEWPRRSYCPRCHVACVRFHPDEERFEVDTNIPHTPSRCERVRHEALTQHAKAAGWEVTT